MKRLTLLFLLSVSLLWGPGCGSSGDLVPVSGNVTVDGKPLDVGTVTYTPDSARGNASLEIFVGEIKEGKYELITGKKKGAAPGAYIVTVESTDLMGANRPGKDPTAAMPKSKIPVKYAIASTSPLRKEVASGGGANLYDLQLSAK